MFRATAALPWDELHDQTCGEDGHPDWHTMVVAGPVRTRDRRGQTSLSWTVTVRCQPPEGPATG